MSEDDPNYRNCSGFLGYASKMKPPRPGISEAWICIGSLCRCVLSYSNGIANEVASHSFNQAQAVELVDAFCPAFPVTELEEGLGEIFYLMYTCTNGLICAYSSQRSYGLGVFGFDWSGDYQSGAMGHCQPSSALACFLITTESIYGKSGIIEGHDTTAFSLSIVYMYCNSICCPS